MAEDQSSQALRDDIEKLKEQMSEMVLLKDQMTDLMKLLEKRNAGENPLAGNIESNATSLLPPHNLGTPYPTYPYGVNGQSYQWPPYGLPVGYAPPIMEAAPEDSPSGIADANHTIPPDQNDGTEIPQAIPQGCTLPPVTCHQAHVSSLGNPTHSHIPNAKPAVVSMIHPYYGMSGLPRGYPAEDPQHRDKLQMLEERLRAIEGSNIGAKDAYDMCLVPNVIIPPKFKVPDFDKYRGATCPANHLTMYCRKMAAFAHDDKLLIHYFQDSLAGAASSWYMQLERTHIRCWKDLANAFLDQYKYNIDMAPDRAQLQTMIKKNNESFKEYAQRWRGLAAQVIPPLSEKEMTSAFMDTLPAPFYDKLIGSVSSNFSDMVTIGERVEAGIRKGRIIPSSDEPHATFNKKRGEVNAVVKDEGKSHYILNSSPAPFQSSQHQGSSQFDPIPMSYADLCNHLISNNLISPRLMRPVQPPFPRGYDSKARCEFHAGAAGHSAENCYPLKHIVQDLIDTKQLSFKEGSEGSTVGAIGERISTDDMGQNPQSRGASDRN